MILVIPGSRDRFLVYEARCKSYLSTPAGKSDQIENLTVESTRSDSVLDRFLITCLRCRWDADSIGEAIKLAKGIDWEDCLQVAEIEFITPLLYSVLKGQNVIPKEYEQAFAVSYIRNRSRNIILLNELNIILQCLKQSNIPVILLKGLALLPEIYSDIGVRPLTDLDLLLKPVDVTTAVHEFIVMGYQPGVESAPGMMLDFESEFILAKSGQPPYYLEIHWKLIDSPYYQERLKSEWLWETAHPLQFNGVEFLVLSHEAQVLHLCAHLHLHHTGEELLWLHDIAELVMKFSPKINWEKLLRLAQESDLVLPVKMTFTRLFTDWQIQIPQDIALQMDLLQASATEVNIYAKLSGPPRGVTHRFFDDMTYLPDWSSRTRFALLNLFPTPAYMKYRYKIRYPLLLPVYYLYRWYLGIASLIHKK